MYNAIMNQTSIVMLAIFVALDVMLVAGLVAIPAIHEAQAISSTALDRNKGQQGEYTLSFIEIHKANLLNIII